MEKSYQRCIGCVPMTPARPAPDSQAQVSVDGFRHQKTVYTQKISTGERELCKESSC